MANSDRDVFELLTADHSTSEEIDYITYAIFAHQKSEWMKHWQKAHDKALPTQTDIDNWIGNITDYQFSGMREKAVDFFDTAARDYLAEEIEDRIRAAVNSGIIAEVKAAGGLWRQVGLALAAAIIAPIIIGGVIALAFLFNDWFPTIRDIVKDVPQQSDQNAAPPTRQAPNG